MRARVCGVVLVMLGLIGSSGAQETELYSRKNTWTVFGEYSNTSSHILMGAARERKLVDVGGAYTRRVLRFRGTSLSYQMEVRPLVLEGDPLTIDHETVVEVDIGGPNLTLTQVSSEVHYGACRPYTTTGSWTTSTGTPIAYFTDVYTCGRQWTYGQSFSPIGFKYAMRTKRRVQPFVVGTLGYMYTNRPVPLADAGSFNFVFDFGAGMEVFRTGKRSVAVECRYHHFSNKDSATENPGTDNVMYKVSYSFGR